jgi:hypothetical protein
MPLNNFLPTFRLASVPSDFDPVTMPPDKSLQLIAQECLFWINA